MADKIRAHNWIDCDMRLSAHHIGPFDPDTVDAANDITGTLNAKPFLATVILPSGRVICEISILAKQALCIGTTWERWDSTPDTWAAKTSCLVRRCGWDWTWIDSDKTPRKWTIYQTWHWPQYGRWNLPVDTQDELLYELLPA